MIDVKMASSLECQISDGAEGNLPISSGIMLKEKRALYTCGSKYVTIDQIPTWKEQCQWIGKIAQSMQYIELSTFKISSYGIVHIG